MAGVTGTNPSILAGISQVGVVEMEDAQAEMNGHLGVEAARKHGVHVRYAHTNALQAVRAPLRAMHTTLAARLGAEVGSVESAFGVADDVMKPLFCEVSALRIPRTAQGLADYFLSNCRVDYAGATHGRVGSNPFVGVLQRLAAVSDHLEGKADLSLQLAMVTRAVRMTFEGVSEKQEEWGHDETLAVKIKLAQATMVLVDLIENRGVGKGNTYWTPISEDLARIRRDLVFVQAVFGLSRLITPALVRSSVSQRPEIASGIPGGVEAGIGRAMANVGSLETRFDRAADPAIAAIDRLMPRSE